MAKGQNEIQWYPGHMTKTRRIMEEDIKQVDVVVEVLDARIPACSKNPDLDTLWKKRPRVIALNKADLADPKCSSGWIARYQEEGYAVAEVSATRGTGLKEIVRLAEMLCHDKIERDIRRGIQNRPVRMMVTGIPNVGKSTLINQLCGRSGAAKTGNRPGVTRGRQWVKIKNHLELLDTPGMLWPKFENQEVAARVALVGSVKDELLNIDDLALILTEILKERYPDCLKVRYALSDEELTLGSVPLIEAIGIRRGYKISGGETDFSRTARMLVDEFRSGKIGRITLEVPDAGTKADA